MAKSPARAERAGSRHCLSNKADPASASASGVAVIGCSITSICANRSSDRNRRGTGYEECTSTARASRTHWLSVASDSPSTSGSTDKGDKKLISGECSPGE